MTRTAAPGDSASGESAPAPGFELHLANFEGPFDLLLSLIAKHKLDITEVALSQVTDEFIAFVKVGGKAWDLEQTSSFLLVASTLLDLKAARLLPQGDVEDEEEAARLRPSGRVKHDEKMTVYVTSAELLELEHARLSLRAEHGLAVDRGRMVREALHRVLADFEEHGDDSALVRRLSAE